MWNITWTSCAYTDQPNNLDGILSTSPKAHWMLGDHSYFAWGYDLFGVSTPPLGVNTPPSVWLQKFEQFIAQSGWQKMYARRAETGMPMFWGPCGDDHGFGGSNWDHTLSAANDPQNGISASGLPDVLTHWVNARAGHALLERAYTDNPVVSGYNGDVPSNMAGLATPSQYPISYWYTDFGTGGRVKVKSSRALPSNATRERNVLIRVITIDCTSYKSPFGATDDSNKHFLGPAQEADILAMCADAVAAGVKAIIIMSNKDLFNIDNNDGWYAYATRRNALLAAIHAAGYPVTWATGDRHYPHVGYATVARGDGYDALSVCACPFATAQTSKITHYPQNLWASTGIDERCYGVITVDEIGQKLKYSIRGADYDEDLWSGIVPFGSRKLII